MKEPDGNALFDLVCAVDNDANACKTLRKNYGGNEERILQADLTEPETHDRIVELTGGRVDVLIGGPPCQSFSSIGPRSLPKKVRYKWEDDHRDALYVEYVRLVERLQPMFIVFENVRGILTKRSTDGERYIDVVTRAIRDCGYSTKVENQSEEYMLLNAADYGVPQIRNRVFVIANRLGLTNRIPPQTHSPDGQVEGTLPYVTLRDAIYDLPRLKAPLTTTGINKGLWHRVHAFNEHVNCGQDDAPYHWDEFERHYNDLGESGRQFMDFIRPLSHEARLTGHRARAQQLSDKRLFKAMKPGETSRDIVYGSDESRKYSHLIKYDMNSFRDKYRKQSCDAPCTTIFAHMQKDGNRFIHPDGRQSRTLTVREAARLQSFPDDFVFTATGNVRFKHIGNAVPPLLARAIGETIYEMWRESRNLKDCDGLTVKTAD